MRRNNIIINDKYFKLYLTNVDLKKIVHQLAEEINTDLQHENEVIFLPILNGSFMFAADLLRAVDLNMRVSFIKLKSYVGIESTGDVEELIGLTESLEGKTVIILEDVVDSGKTVIHLRKLIQPLNPKAIKICALFFKPKKFTGNFSIDYIGKSIPNDFIVGYGMDYDERGRNLRNIYTLLDD